MERRLLVARCLVASRGPYLRLDASTGEGGRGGEVTTHTHQEEFTVGLPRLQVWEVMSDTQHLNQLFFGLEASTVVSRDPHKARLRGTFGVLAPEYDEFPWAFAVPSHYENKRVFPRGVLRSLSTQCHLDELGPSETKVRYIVDVEGRSFVGVLAARYVVARTRRGLAQAQMMLNEMAQKAITTPSSSAPEPGPIAALAGIQWPPANPFRAATLAKAAPLVDQIRPQCGPGVSALNALMTHIADGTDADVARMRPYELATAWGTDRRETLSVFLRAAKGGLLRLSWDLLCPSCEAPTTVSSLKDLPSAGHCPACDIDFSSSFDDNVEATFSPEPTIRQAERLVFCHGSPSSTRSWLAQLVVEPGAQRTLELNLPPGRYRFQGAGLKSVGAFEVVADDSGVANVSGDEAVDVAIAADSDGGVVVPARVGGGAHSFRIKNTDGVARRIQLAHRAFASMAATATDVTGIGLFRELFGREVLAPDQHVAVGRSVIMFTDLVGSTAMYERLGDAAAYGLVREHFGLLTAAISAHNGRIVKTVGDAVMAAYDLPKDGVLAGIACIRALRTLKAPNGAPSGLKLKVGLHTGACLAIEANGATDYFGRTVNIAARVESLAAPDELVLSWAIMADADATAAAYAAGVPVAVDHRKVKGIEDGVEVARLSLAEDP